MKNLAHVRFGRLTKKWEELSKTKVLDLVEARTGTIEAALKKEIQQGPTEKQIVHSGLDETMTTACRETMATADKFNTTFRKAAYINALTKIKTVYGEAGIIFG